MSRLPGRTTTTATTRSPHRPRDADLGESVPDCQHRIRRRKAALREAVGDDQGPIHHIGGYLSRQSPSRLAMIAGIVGGVGLTAALAHKPLFKLAKASFPLAGAASKLAMAYTLAHQRKEINEEKDD